MVLSSQDRDACHHTFPICYQWYSSVKQANECADRHPVISNYPKSHKILMLRDSWSANVLTLP